MLQAEIFSSRLEVSLTYDSAAGKLTLGVIQARLAAPAVRNLQGSGGI